jgi:hypothetical protein
VLMALSTAAPVIGGLGMFLGDLSSIPHRGRLPREASQ